MNLRKISEVTEPAARVQIDDAANKAHLVAIATRKSSRRSFRFFLGQEAMQRFLFSPLATGGASAELVNRSFSKHVMSEHLRRILATP